ncbi:hypothetical protein HOC80_00175 [archaeon]|nr:hypothetical protein [archaeon]MBT4416500.1 hypothetical protein [archaeon]
MGLFGNLFGKGKKDEEHSEEKAILNQARAWSKEIGRLMKQLDEIHWVISESYQKKKVGTAKQTAKAIEDPSTDVEGFENPNIMYIWKDLMKNLQLIYNNREKIFQALDIFAKDKPYVEKTKMFIENKFKPSVVKRINDKIEFFTLGAYKKANEEEIHERLVDLKKEINFLRNPILKVSDNLGNTIFFD